MSQKPLLPLSGPARPPLPKPERRLDEIPHHAAVAGARDRDAHRPGPGTASRGRVRSGDDAGRWSVIDLNSPVPGIRSAGSSLGAASGLPASRQARVPAQPAAVWLDPLDYLDQPLPVAARTAERDADAAPILRAQYGASVPSGTSHRSGSRRLGDPTHMASDRVSNAGRA